MSLSTMQISSNSLTWSPSSTDLPMRQRQRQRQRQRRRQRQRQQRRQGPRGWAWTKRGGERAAALEPCVVWGSSRPHACTGRHRGGMGPAWQRCAAREQLGSGTQGKRPRAKSAVQREGEGVGAHTRATQRGTHHDTSSTEAIASPTSASGKETIFWTGAAVRARQRWRIPFRAVGHASAAHTQTHQPSRLGRPGQCTGKRRAAHQSNTGRGHVNEGGGGACVAGWRAWLR